MTLRGLSADRVTYTIKKRVRARSEAEARALLKAAAVRTYARNGSAGITLAHPRSRRRHGIEQPVLICNRRKSRPLAAICRYTTFRARCKRKPAVA